MLTTSNNDILFDDLAIIQSLYGAGQPGNLSLSYNDCIDNYNDCIDNVYKSQTAENPSPDCNCSGYTSIEGDEERSSMKAAAQNMISNSDCSS